MSSSIEKLISTIVSGQLPMEEGESADLYLIRDCASSPGWFYDVEIDGNRIELPMVHGTHLEAIEYARFVISERKGPEFAQRAKFKIVFTPDAKP